MKRKSHNLDTLQVSTETTVPDYFGGCPRCGKNDGYLNLRRAHIFICREHKTAWCAGENLFRSWRNETPETWERNRRVLQTENYQLVEPLYPDVLPPPPRNYRNSPAIRRRRRKPATEEGRVTAPREVLDALDQRLVRLRELAAALVADTDESQDEALEAACELATILLDLDHYACAGALPRAWQ